MRQVAREAAPDNAAPIWRYRLLLAKQADLVNTVATASVTVPTGWRVTGSAARFRVTAKEVRTSTNGTTVTVTTPLKEDLLLDVTLSPA